MGTTTQTDLDVAQYCLRLGDDALVLAQRLSEWAARSPQLEEDVALLNLALDLLGQARSLLTLAGEREGAGRDEDDLAFLRDETDVVNAQICELDGGDFGRTMARQLLVSAYALPLWQELSTSTDEGIAGVAGKAVKEAAYHLDHARSWVVRLGDGTAESHRRVQAAWTPSGPTPPSCSRPTPCSTGWCGGGRHRSGALEPRWRAHVEDALAEATLTVPDTTGARAGAAAGSTPRPSATCSPSCSTCTAPTRASRGDDHGRPARGAGAGRRPRDPRS
jgi:ring-1,2-phenylacetyl-CoA epoxidase subunit PaaC